MAPTSNERRRSVAERSLQLTHQRCLQVCIPSMLMILTAHHPIDGPQRQNGCGERKQSYDVGRLEIQNDHLAGQQRQRVTARTWIMLSPRAATTNNDRLNSSAMTTSKGHTEDGLKHFAIGGLLESTTLARIFSIRFHRAATTATRPIRICRHSRISRRRSAAPG